MSGRHMDERDPATTFSDDARHSLEAALPFRKADLPNVRDGWLSGIVVDSLNETEMRGLRDDVG